MKTAVMVIVMAFSIIGCSSHPANPNSVMMDKTMGELDRETAK